MKILLVLISSIFSVAGYAQILPGMDHESIHSHMNKYWGDYELREPPNADELDFIKFEHVSGDKTLIVFMSEDGICRFTRLIVDIDYLDDMIELFNSDFDSSGVNKWIAKERGEEFYISIDESDWIFTVTVRSVDEIT